MERLINWRLLSNPANWVIIFLIFYLVALAARVLFSAAENGAPISLPEGL